MSDNNNQPGLEPEDYYLDKNGLMVFTAIYLKKRGYCCKNGCRHCPYNNLNPEQDVDNHNDNE